MFPEPRADTRIPPSLFCLPLLFFSPLLVYSVSTTGVTQQTWNLSYSKWWRAEGLVCVCEGGGSTYHAQLINELVLICHRKAQFSWVTHGDETNHLHHCGTMAARLFLAEKCGFREGRTVKGLSEVWLRSRRKAQRDVRALSEKSHYGRMIDGTCSE